MNSTVGIFHAGHMFHPMALGWRLHATPSAASLGKTSLMETHISTLPIDTTTRTSGGKSSNGGAKSQFSIIHFNTRNFGILIGFMLFFMCTYLGATELISSKKSKGEVLVFPRNAMPKRGRPANDEEDGRSQTGIISEKPAQQESKEVAGILRQTAIFHWENVIYDIKIKKEERRILDHVSGWVKPGTLTCLMGVSGAGKTTLLDVLASRVTMGVIDGEMLVDGRPRDDSFQRKTGYVQQQDLHLSTSTVREALRFSALLRQPAKVPRQEKLDYVEEVLNLLEMDTYSNAVVGVLGEGLNVEQRKRLTIGVELVAKP